MGEIGGSVGRTQAIASYEKHKLQNRNFNRFIWQFELKWEDLWIGAFWKKSQESDSVRRFDLWICLIPCVPLHIWKRYHEV